MSSIKTFWVWVWVWSHSIVFRFSAALRSCFNDHGFLVLAFRDLTGCQMIEAVQLISQYNHTGLKYHFLCMMSHGSQDWIEGIDGHPVSYQSLIDLLEKAPMPKLVKVLIIQACRAVAKYLPPGKLNCYWYWTSIIHTCLLLLNQYGWYLFAGSEPVLSIPVCW